MSASIITLADRRPVESQPEIDADAVYLNRLFDCPAYMALPFLTPRDPTEEGIGFGRVKSYWNDVPTDDGHADYQRGKSYAQMAVAAIEEDQCCSNRGLQLTFEHIFRDAVQRREKRGKYSRSMPPASVAFLNEIASIIYRKAKGDAA